MGIYRDRFLPWFVDKTCGTAELAEHRQRIVAGLRGTVLEIGFGSGHNVPYYPEEIDRVLAVDPALRGRELAADRLARSPIPVEFIGLDGADLPLDDQSVDAALSTWTLCTIPEVERALEQIRRVLKPDGALHFLEHGLAESSATQRRQNRIDPLWTRIAGGCHVNRPIDRLLADAGFAADPERFTLRGPATFGSMYAGVAR